MRIRWRGLELPSRVVKDARYTSDTYGRFTIEPFERGFGTTVGNGLRRVLLSSLEGAAVDSIKIKGAEHEFTSVAGVLEDVTDIVLNVKSMVVRLDTDEPKTMRLAVRGPGEITADMIEADAAITILNKNLLIATLTDEIDFEMEFTVAKGRGYVPASETSRAVLGSSKDFLATPGAKRFMLALFGAAFSAALFVVPLNVLAQRRAEPLHRARLLAAGALLLNLSTTLSQLMIATMGKLDIPMHYAYVQISLFSLVIAAYAFYRARASKKGIDL